VDDASVLGPGEKAMLIEVDSKQASSRRQDWDNMLIKGAEGWTPFHRSSRFIRNRQRRLVKVNRGPGEHSVDSLFNSSFANGVGNSFSSFPMHDESLYDLDQHSPVPVTIDLEAFSAAMDEHSTSANDAYKQSDRENSYAASNHSHVSSMITSGEMSLFESNKKRNLALSNSDLRIYQYDKSVDNRREQSTKRIGGIIDNFDLSERFGSSYLPVGSRAATFSKRRINKSGQTATRGPGVSLHEMPPEKLQSGYPMFQ
jgi:hypothetical protein